MKLKDEAIARQLEDLLTKSIVAKFKSQGHVATGKGIASIQTKVKDKLDGLLIQISGLDYMGKQDSGLKAGEVKMTSQLLSDLEKWVIRKGIVSEMRAAKRVAFFIGRNMERIGMHSRNKRIDMSKRGGISMSIKEQSSTINKMLFKMFEKNFNLVVTNLTTDLTKTIINL